jgi:hypothetical protein
MSESESAGPESIDSMISSDFSLISELRLGRPCADSVCAGGLGRGRRGAETRTWSQCPLGRGGVVKIESTTASVS